MAAQPAPLILVRAANQEDLPLLVSMSRETFVDSYEHLNDPIPFWDYVDAALTEDVFQKEMETPGSAFFLAFYDGFPAGFCKINLHKTAPGLPTDLPQIELERIYTQKLYKHMGIGVALLHKAIHIGRSGGCKKLWLAVWQKNTAGIQWYEKQGFERFGTQIFMMGAEPQTDWLMQITIE